ncbi:MAG: penicillin-binding protein 2 [Candidatus Omnitrophica bacterium]|nr:penicillin-binding protein 2 [Candidatus Omnitrophota bacterium]
MYTNDYHRRTQTVFGIFIIFFLILIIRLLFIQFFHSEYLSKLAQKQHLQFVELEPRRGTIYDRNLNPLAVNINCDSLFAEPNQLLDKDKEKIIKQLSPILNVQENFLRERLYRDKSFVWLARKLNNVQSNAVRRLNLPGINFIKESKRCYPNGYLASHVIGFAGLDNRGLEGLELYYDRYLRGEKGYTFFLRDARQKKLDLLAERMVSPKDGYDLILTIDSIVQFIAERELEKAVKENNAKGGSIIVMDPHTGEILALANRPTYDLNEYTTATKDQIRNRAICDLFEPGSVFKIVTASVALEENKMKEEDRFFCENGAYKVASHTLHDHRPHGWLTFKEVVEQSSNIGVVKIAQVLGSQLLYKYIKIFGFGSKTGIDLSGEVSGIVKEPRLWSSISISVIPIGQEVAVTALQLVNAISVIANGGRLMRPYLVQEIRDRNSETIKAFSPVMIRKVISLETAQRMRDILIGVVKEGTGKLADLPDITVAGKTGTAQKIEPQGRYSYSRFMASFIGFAPAHDPLIAIAVVIDEPHPYYFGGVVAAPVFKNVAIDVIRYLRSNQPLRQAMALNIQKETQN